jgi:hypothetical protein
VKVKAVEFDGEEEPESLTVTMSVDEAALIYAYTGRTASLWVTKATGREKWGEVNDDIAGCLAGTFFNRFYENGANDVLVLSIDAIVAAKNEARA